MAENAALGITEPGLLSVLHCVPRVAVGLHCHSGREQSTTTALNQRMETDKAGLYHQKDKHDHLLFKVQLFLFLPYKSVLWSGFSSVSLALGATLKQIIEKYREENIKVGKFGVNQSVSLLLQLTKCCW